MKPYRFLYGDRRLVLDFDREVIGFLLFFGPCVVIGVAVTGVIFLASKLLKF